MDLANSCLSNTNINSGVYNECSLGIDESLNIGGSLSGSSLVNKVNAKASSNISVLNLGSIIHVEDCVSSVI